MEGASVAIFIMVQKIYYPFLCIMGIPGSYLDFSFYLKLLFVLVSGTNNYG